MWAVGAGQKTRTGVVPPSGTTGSGCLRAFLRTVDGVPIDAAYDPGPVVYDPSRTSGDHGGSPSGERGGGPSEVPAIVVAHGFTGDLERPQVRRVASVLSGYGAVITFSFRGHGASGGRSTVGDREVLDLAAAVAWARELGHTRVVTVGFSMGGSVVLRQGAADAVDGRLGHPAPRPDAVVSVSSPARWYYRGTAPMRRLHWMVLRPEGRLVGRLGFRTRIHHQDWDPVPLSPVEAVPLLAPAPLLVVHGDRDAYFPLDHPRMLAEAAGEHGELWIERGMGHAENATGVELLHRIGGWIAATAG